MTIRFDERVAIVTGGGNGLGREHCLALASRGAKVVVNDLGGSLDGSGSSSNASERVAAEIRAQGGQAIANGADITDFAQVEAMVGAAKEKWGRVDILINNAGILRDKTFAKMEIADFEKVLDVHLFGTLHCTKAVWETMREQKYGRILMTSSASGIYGNFGQANYGAAKAAMVGLMNVLHHEGAKYDIRVNTLAPTAATRMLEDLIESRDVKRLMNPKSVSPGVLYLVSEDAPSKTILGAGAGCFSVVRIFETQGAFLGESTTVDDVAANWDAIADRAGEKEITAAFEQTNKFVEMAAKALRVELDLGGAK